MTHETKLVWPAALAIIAVILLVSLLGIMAINKNVDSKQSPVVDFAPVIEAIDANSAKLDTLITDLNEEQTVVPSDKVDKLCSLTDGCAFYTATGSDKTDALDVVVISTSNKYFKRAVANLVGIDKDYLNIQSVKVKDTQVRAYTKNDKTEDNWEVQKFVKVKYFDEDRTNSDVQTVYVLVTSTLDEGDFESLSLVEVDRTFEFD